MNKSLISESSEWSFELIEKYDREIAAIAQEFKLDTYPNQIEVISSEQMMDAYAATGMPIGYNHWSYGKQFLSVEQGYKRGQMGLAYEIVINSNPCIAYLMEENTLTMQALVIAHACYGHNSFFKGNYLFKSWTDADSIVDYLVFAKNYIAKCEERFGIEEVENLLDSCHALMHYGVDRYKRPYPLSTSEELEQQEERELYLQKQVNDLWRTIPNQNSEKTQDTKLRYPSEPQENILYFIEKNAPLLEPWQREVIRIVRKLAQYFYPQRQTQVMNEGWACFWHYHLLNELYDRGKVNEGFMFEFMQSHTSVIYQPPYNSPYFSGINPYTLGFNMMMDIKRICQQPSKEDKHWFPELAGSPWLESLDFAMRNFKDESFVLQYLSPKLMRDLKLFSIIDDDANSDIEVNAIHDDPGYQQVREALSAQYNLGNNEPNIQVYSADVRGDRSLTLHHYRHNRKPLDDGANEVLKHVHRLWGFDVHLHSLEGDQLRQEFHCPEQKPAQATEAKNNIGTSINLSAP
ncbi:SpoVR family protein [Agaribacterium sp. ZY112]|uniref:SpoVR family protein n=1 Tax=Agaribacterium sp. ZY112 TaxID=3233574 RepID=UPI003525265D